MKSFHPNLLLVCSLFFGSVKQIVAQDIGIEKNKEIIKQLEYKWLMAEFKLDTATIASMMDEKFIAIGLNSLASKQEELVAIYKNMDQRKQNKHIVDSLYLDDFQIQQYDNTAIVTFISVTKGSIKGVPFANRRTRMYDVWIKNSGEWKAVASQVTAIK